MKKSPYFDYAKYANLATSIGLTMVASIFLGYWGGSWLDDKLGTAPWLMLLGMLGGIGVGFYSIFRELQALERIGPGDESGDDQDKPKPKP